MSSGWAAVVVAAIMMLLTAAAVVWRDGRRDGRTDTILERLTAIAEDHEYRLRAVERGGTAHRPAHRRKTQ